MLCCTSFSKLQHNNPADNDTQEPVGKNLAGSKESSSETCLAFGSNAFPPNLLGGGAFMNL